MGDTKNGFSVAKVPYEKSYTVTVPHSLIFEEILPFSLSFSLPIYNNINEMSIDVEKKIWRVIL